MRQTRLASGVDKSVGVGSRFDPARARQEDQHRRRDATARYAVVAKSLASHADPLERKTSNTNFVPLTSRRARTLARATSPAASSAAGTSSRREALDGGSDDDDGSDDGSSDGSSGDKDYQGAQAAGEGSDSDSDAPLVMLPPPQPARNTMSPGMLARGTATPAVAATAGPLAASPMASGLLRSSSDLPYAAPSLFKRGRSVFAATPPRTTPAAWDPPPLHNAKRMRAGTAASPPPVIKLPAPSVAAAPSTEPRRAPGASVVSPSQSTDGDTQGTMRFFELGSSGSASAMDHVGGSVTDEAITPARYGGSSSGSGGACSRLSAVAEAESSSSIQSPAAVARPIAKAAARAPVSSSRGEADRGAGSGDQGAIAIGSSSRAQLLLQKAPVADKTSRRDAVTAPSLVRPFAPRAGFPTVRPFAPAHGTPAPPPPPPMPSARFAPAAAAAAAASLSPLAVATASTAAVASAPTVPRAPGGGSRDAKSSRRALPVTQPQLQKQQPKGTADLGLLDLSSVDGDSDGDGDAGCGGARTEVHSSKVVPAAQLASSSASRRPPQQQPSQVDKRAGLGTTTAATQSNDASSRPTPSRGRTLAQVSAVTAARSATLAALRTPTSERESSSGIKERELPRQKVIDASIARSDAPTAAQPALATAAPPKQRAAAAQATAGPATPSAPPKPKVADERAAAASLPSTPQPQAVAAQATASTPAARKARASLSLFEVRPSPAGVNAATYEASTATRSVAPAASSLREQTAQAAAVMASQGAPPPVARELSFCGDVAAAAAAAGSAALPTAVSAALKLEWPGRDSAIDALVGAYSTPATPAPVLMLYGRPGAGKSSFLSSLRRAAGLLAARIACDEIVGNRAIRDGGAVARAFHEAVLSAAADATLDWMYRVVVSAIRDTGRAAACSGASGVVLPTRSAVATALLTALLSSGSDEGNACAAALVRWGGTSAASFEGGADAAAVAPGRFGDLRDALSAASAAAHRGGDGPGARSSARLAPTDRHCPSFNVFVRELRDVAALRICDVRNAVGRVAGNVAAAAALPEVTAAGIADAAPITLHLQFDGCERLLGEPRLLQLLAQMPTMVRRLCVC